MNVAQMIGWLKTMPYNAEVDVVTRSDDPFKINNNHRAFYSRKFMAENPEFGEIFRTRQQLSV